MAIKKLRFSRNLLFAIALVLLLTAYFAVKYDLLIIDGVSILIIIITVLFCTAAIIEAILIATQSILSAINKK